MVKIGNDWDELLKNEWEKPYYRDLRSFLLAEYRAETVYPPAEDIFNALKLTPYSEVKVVILGQDPYHEPGQAEGLAFSVKEGVALPPSLVNIFRELRDDLGVNTGTCGSLRPWAERGVLLLNTVLTVRAHQAASHKDRGWEQLTDRIIELLAERENPMVFVLWGAKAIAKKLLIEQAAETTGSGRRDLEAEGCAMRRHLIITAPHPSPLSAHRGFFGGRYFSRCNYFLQDNGIEPIDWSLESDC
ncbi:MAG: uracil-DNA glycosylase [Mogibacterium sp.]|nr:uracil-DNA glycosylase [Mogibacterium sp.]